MALAIETFSNVKGGSSLFKALGHPLAAPRLEALIARLALKPRVALYDPDGFAATLGALFDLTRLAISDVYVQNVEALDRPVLGRRPRPVTDLAGTVPDALLVATFDADRPIQHLALLLDPRTEVVSLDAARVPGELVTNSRHYLDPLNFATNLAFFRDGGGDHTRIVTANYWAGYGARGARLWLRLFDEAGASLAEWTEPLPDVQGGLVIDSAEVRRRFGLGPFAGQLYMHLIGAAGHDVVKYALDVYGDAPDVLSCTHDANAWPADLYAGLPAPAEGERVLVWLENSHATPVPAGEIGLNLMGDERVVAFDRPIAGYGTAVLDVAKLLPEAAWPQQIEIRAGRHLTRPRYEVVRANGRRLIAHANVERIDLKPDPRIPELANLFGKGFILPAPILPVDRYRSTALPTPMATGQADLPVAAILVDASGAEVARHRFGRLLRRDSVALDLNAALDRAGARLASGYGHVELVYDFAEGGGADGWLHGLFRYEDLRTGHAADTSFGSHIFNTTLVYKGEPQSYAGRPPGLSTRLFLRLGQDGLDTLCHLIYPASTPWHPHSSTELILVDDAGVTVARREVRIPCGGSLHWRCSKTFEADELRRAGPRGYVIVRDATCRLFGYHGLIAEDLAFSLDHMFGF
jgi:hypothetical protein